MLEDVCLATAPCPDSCGWLSPAVLVHVQCKPASAALPWSCSVEDLCKAIENELRADEVIKRANILPPFINLPELTSVEYVEVSQDHNWSISAVGGLALCCTLQPTVCACVGDA